MFTYREEYYLQGRDPSEAANDHSEKFTLNKTDNWRKRMDAARGKAELIIGKNRHGKPETIKLKFSGDYSLFDDLDEGFNTADDNRFASAPVPQAAAAQNSQPAMEDIPFLD
jgi:hypothetical protein